MINFAAARPAGDSAIWMVALEISRQSSQGSALMEGEEDWSPEISAAFLASFLKMLILLLLDSPAANAPQSRKATQMSLAVALTIGLTSSSQTRCSSGLGNPLQASSMIILAA